MPTDPTSGSVTGVTEEMIAAAANAISASFDVIPGGEEPFTGWSSILAERALSAARSVDPLQERVRELEEALNEIATAEDDWDDLRAIARAALSAPGPQQGEKDG